MAGDWVKVPSYDLGSHIRVTVSGGVHVPAQTVAARRVAVREPVPRQLHAAASGGQRGVCQEAQAAAGAGEGRAVQVDLELTQDDPRLTPA